MFVTLAKVAIRDFDQFLSVFATAGARLRRQYGSTQAQAFRVSDNPALAVVLIHWPDAGAFDQFKADPIVRETMRQGGATAPPEFVVVDPAGTFPG